MSESPFAEVLASLTRQRGVLGSMVVSEADGIVVDSNLQIGVRGNVVAALAASLYRKARLSAAAAGLGTASFVQLEAEQGRVCAVGRGDLLLVTVAESRANVGLIRVEMLRATQVLE
ncbi:MAG TPA: roadblock/LC7 domain-containing protein [Gemmatimonadaceae bacterium]|nr:roadblock/LC7 domain-containing protein [Gemmatimonadaceae bacterium]